jgi:DNA polymerase-1
VTVKTDCDLSGHLPGWPSVEALASGGPIPPALLAFYAAHGFKTWKRELEGRGRDGGASRAALRAVG